MCKIGLAYQFTENKEVTFKCEGADVTMKCNANGLMRKCKSLCCRYIFT